MSTPASSSTPCSASRFDDARPGLVSSSRVRRGATRGHGRGTLLGLECRVGSPARQPGGGRVSSPASPRRYRFDLG